MRDGANPVGVVSVMPWIRWLVQAFVFNSGADPLQLAQVIQRPGQVGTSRSRRTRVGWDA